VTLPLLLSLFAGITQGPGPARLERPEAVLPEQFSLIRGVRELSDGRVLVTDWTEQRLLMVDAGFRRTRPLASVGAGPEEFRLPAGLFPVGGDSTLLVDVGNARLSLITPEGRIARSIAATRPGLGSPGGVDALGRVYYAIPSWAQEAGGIHEDSTTIVRLEPATDRTIPLTVVRGTTWPRHKGPRLTPGMGHVAFAAQDAWRVAPDGTLIIVRATGYRIERIGARGPSAGPSYQYTPDRVTKADRLAYVREFLARSPTSGRGPYGGMGHSPMLSAAEIAKMEETNEFAAELPPFNPAWVFLGPDGELWVGRGRHAGQPIVYDRFDPAGTRVGQVSVAANRSVVGIGRRFVYVAATDEDGLQTLERFPRPAP
jgi:hypothetical protein